MTKRLSLTGSFLVLLGLLLAGPGSLTYAKPKQDDRYRSPRDTVRTFLTAITLAQGTPRYIQEAISCLDVSGLPAGQKNTAGLLAAHLEAVLRAREVDTDIIPDESTGTVYVFPDGHGQRIALARMRDGRWLFDRETVTQIPRLYAETQKQRHERNRETATLSVPPEFASPRATFRSIVEGYRRQDQERILRCFDLSEIPAVARLEVGAQLASKLKQIVLRSRLPILQEVPDSNYSDPYVFLSQPEGVIELVRINSGERKGEWVFSRETVRSLDKLYVEFEDKPYPDEVVGLGKRTYLPHFRTETELWVRSRLPGWLRVSVLSTRRMTLELYELIGYVLAPALAYGVYRLSAWLLALLLQWLLVRRGWTLPRSSILDRLRASGMFVGVLVLRWALLVLEPDSAVLVVILVVLNPLVWISGMWAIFRLLDLITDLMEAHLTAERGRPEITQMFWPVVSLALKIVLFVVTMFHLMALFAWDITAVLTGLGIGGVAFALGAQDSLKNLFGSFTLIADRPFVVGESVKIGNHEVGMVEVVGLRSTRIRTIDDTLLIVPNSSLTTMDITNYGRRRYRRYQTRIGLSYATPLEKLVAFRDGIEKVILAQERTRKDKYDVAIHDLGSSSIEIMLNLYFEVSDGRGELAARDALIRDILRLEQELQVEKA